MTCPNKSYDEQPNKLNKSLNETCLVSYPYACRVFVASLLLPLYTIIITRSARSPCRFCLVDSTVTAKRIGGQGTGGKMAVLYSERRRKMGHHARLHVDCMCRRPNED